jgi:hypothetical protein
MVKPPKTRKTLKEYAADAAARLKKSPSGIKPATKENSKSKSQPKKGK